MADRINFYRTPVDRKILRTLTKRRNLPGLFQSMTILTFYLLTTAMSLYFFLQGKIVLTVAACVFHSLFSNFLGMEASVHELSHKTPFKSKWLNEFFYGIFSFLTWNNPVHFRESHRRHHHATVFKGRDNEVILVPGALGIIDYISWFFFDWKKFMKIMPANLAFFFGRDQPDVFFWDPLFEKDDPRRKRMFWWARFQFIGHVALAVLFARAGYWVLIYTVSFSYFFFNVLSNSCGFVQHQGLKPNIPDWRMSCHTMIFGPVMSFFYWRMNYHVEHHMFAAVPFYNLPKLHKLLEDDTAEPVYGFWKAVRKVAGLLKRQRKEPGWFYTPKLPVTANPARMPDSHSAASQGTP